MPKNRFRRYGVLILLVWAGSAFWQVNKPLPDGIGTAWPWREAESVQFLADRTFLDAQGQRRHEQQIFDSALGMIRQAQRLIVLDMFLFNDWGVEEGKGLLPLSEMLTQALLERLQQAPDLRVVVLTDPINTAYGGLVSPYLSRLQEAGAEVVLTDLSRLRGGNPLWSGPWALCCAWWGNAPDAGWLPNPLGPGKITLRSWLALPNFRANHRKVLVVDHGPAWQALVASANPHDASSWHDNVALQFSGAAAVDILASEAAVARFSAPQGMMGFDSAFPSNAPVTQPRLRLLTEKAIEAALLEALDSAQEGESVDVAVFYLASRTVVEGLLRAHRRGVALRILLDPNEDAFGRKKNGVPNRQVAHELVQAGVPLRWCDTHGEQCHSKYLHYRGKEGDRLIVGSANFTRRNLDNLNLEASVELRAPASFSAMQDASLWFEENWNNTGQRHFSVEAARYQDDSLWRQGWYRAGEAWGWSTW